MKKIILILTFACFITHAKAQTFNPLLAAMLQDTLNTYVSQISNIKGMSASVFIPGQGVWTGVTGNSYSGKPITKDMRFGIASNTKLFVGVMMLKLAESKVFSLDDSIKKWVTIANPNISPNITIRQLLNHTSGVSDPFSVSPWFDTIRLNPTRVFTPNEVLGWIGTPLFPVGTSWQYSNTNYLIAGMVAQSASGVSLAKLIRDSILNPLNMDSTFIDFEEPTNGTLAHRWWNTIDYHDTSRVGLNSSLGYAGNIFSTSSEMVVWYDALFSGKVLSKKSMEELTSFVYTVNPILSYGLGLSRDVTQGLPYWGHGGSTWGYKSKMMYDSCLKVAVGGFANSFPAGMDGVTFLLYRVVKNHIPGCSGAIVGETVVCQGANDITYTIPPIPNASSYVWSLPAGVAGTSTTNTITANFGAIANSGLIKVTGLNTYGLGGSAELYITIKPKPGAPVITQNGNILSSNVSVGNQWYNSAGKIVGATNASYTITSSDSFYCLVTLDACSSERSNVIYALYSGLNAQSNGYELRIYPNPFQSQTTLETSIEMKDARVMLSNCYGQIVKEIQGINGHTFTLNRSDLPIGLYFIQLVQAEKIIATKKLMINN